MKSLRVALILICSFGLAILLIILFETNPIYANSLSVKKNLNRDDVKIEQQVLDEIAINGQSDFIVRFIEQADLSPAYFMDWKTRGEFVYKLLTDTADRSQANAIALLKAGGVDYQTFIAGNDLYVKSGSLAMVNSLSDLSEVSTIRAPRTYYIDPIIEIGPLDSITWAGDLLSKNSLTTVGRSTDSTIDWGLTDTKADQFWSVFGQGDGILVANIDTGVQWDHPALDQSYKCGTDASDPSCWDDPGNVCGGSACDNNGHGTHTMGTMVGDDDPGLNYSVGMAPGAQWIACKGCETNSCSEFALNTCADWILAPNGDPDNRPNVVNNSWGGGGGDSWYQIKVQAWVAAGIFPAFAAGNTGSSCGTLNSPGDYQVSFATGAHDSTRTIASFSSRGPSAFGHDPYTKPNISAPGVNICSAVPTDGWNCNYNGTSMASPHTAGAVSLLWSCNPGLIGQIEPTFAILQESAAAAPEGTCGTPPDGDGNYTYGYGYLDVYSAGLSVCNAEFGSLNGFVYDDNDNPIAGAVVTADLDSGGYRNKVTTDQTGFYTMTLVTGSYDVTAGKAGFTSQTVTDIVIEPGLTTNQDFSLTANGWAYGYVTDFDTGLPVELATVSADDGSSTTTDDSGYYILGLNPGTYTLTVSARGYAIESASVSISSRIGTNQDFIIQAAVKFTPSPIDLSIDMGNTESISAIITNHQTSNYEFEFLEQDQGYVPVGTNLISLNIAAGPVAVAADTMLAASAYQARPDRTISIQRRVSAYRPNVLLLNADDDNTSGSPIQQTLLAYGDLGAVDLFDARSTTPALQQLEAYAAVVVWSNYYFANPTAIGDVLADYVDAGGKVIDLMGALEPMYGYQGRFRTGHYSAIELSGLSLATSCLGTYDNLHPIMAGVTSVCDFYRGINSTLTTGSHEVARWQDDELFVGVKENRSVASINGYVGYSFVWTGQLADVLHNAINFLAGSHDAPWLSEVPVSGTIPSESSLPVGILFDASLSAGVIQPGDYEASLILKGGTDQPDVDIPVMMTVTPPSNYGKLEGTVIGLGYCDGSPSPLQDAMVAIEGGIAVETDSNGDYLLWLPAGTYAITVTTESHISESAPVEIFPLGQATVQDFNLYWDKPCLAVDPTMIEDTLQPGDVSTHTLHINNNGSGNLEYDFITSSLFPQLLLHFDDPEGSTIFLDSSGNDYNGSCSGTSCPLAGVAGRINTAVQFDGINDYIEVQHNSAFDLIESQGKVAIAAWVNINNWYNGWFPIIDKYESLFHLGWIFQAHATGGLNFTTFFTGISCPYTLNLHTWYHLAVSYDQPAGFIRFYVNGARVCEKAFSTTIMDTQGVPLYVGYSPSGSAEYSNGIIDELAIFSEALSAGDIQSLYLNGYSGPPWLSVTPISGTVPSDGGMNASVRLDSTDLIIGTYSTNLSLNSNDPITPQVIIPVTLLVVTAPPEIPVYPDPQDEEVDVPVSQSLSWQASPHAEAYDLYLWALGETKPELPTASDLYQASYDPPGNLLTGITYSWQVIAKNAAGNTPGPEWSFTTGEPTPVRMASFSSTPLLQGVQLDWQSAQEVFLLGFNLLRSESSNGTRRIINPQLIPGINPGELHSNDYQYLDVTVEAGKAYYYWIEWVEKSRSEYFGPVITDVVRFIVWLPLGLR